MRGSNLVRFSRDGDEFHYLWAARQCLRLLSPSSDLVALSIEGVSLAEAGNGASIEGGEQVIDIAEYYGSEYLANASLVRYCQLKHSTQSSDAPWTQSGLAITLKGFSERYQALIDKLGAEHCDRVLQFSFITNRPINEKILQTISDVATGVKHRHPKEAAKLQSHTGLEEIRLSSFCRLLHIEGGHEGYLDQRNSLTQDFGQYLPGDDVDAPIQLKELVRRKALSESAESPTITKTDVLRALKTDEGRLFPAACMIEEPKKVIPREQENEIFSLIANSATTPTIVHADGGVGKSIFVTRIRHGLPAGSLTILYDCFGNGQYRNTSSLRHRHKDALVQIANELASKGLCYPLIPSVHADSGDYLRAFKHRLDQGVKSLREIHPDALLCVVVDAADNAQMAAEELSETRSFIVDLLRETLPEGVRLVATCRTHRQNRLIPPQGISRIKLKPFSRSETEIFLRQVFPDASSFDVDEFHRLSSENPRVQATALSWEQPLQETLRALGPNPKSAEDTIADLLDHAIALLKDKVGAVEGSQIDSICIGLAALRPRVPIKVLAAISAVSESAIRSFAVDLGRPLLLAGDAVQFFDEPSETWFRDRFKPTANEFSKFIEILKPLATSSSYVAAVLPQLMLEAGHFSELVELALSSEALPETSPLEKRDVELQRLQFAVKASLRAKRYADAAKLALKAGGETAAEDRQHSLIQENTDLAALFMDANLTQELVSRRVFAGGWIGVHHAYEAGLLSGRSELKADARSRLRMAHEWLRNWNRLDAKDRKREQVHYADIAEMAMAHLNIHGAKRAADSLRGWSPCDVSFRAGQILSSRLVDQERYSDLDELGAAAGNDLGLVLAVVKELAHVHRTPPFCVVKRALRLLRHPKVKLARSNDFDHEETILAAVTALVITGYRLAVYDNGILASILSIYLPENPPRGLSTRFSSSRFTLLRAYTLRAALSGQSLQLNDLAHTDLRKSLEDARSYRSTQEVQEFEESVGALLPWHQLWANVLLGQVTADQLDETISEVRTLSSKAANTRYREETYTSDEIARIWFDILVEGASDPQSGLDEFNLWIETLRRPLFTPTLTDLVRLAARQGKMRRHAFGYASTASNISDESREDAESTVSSYVNLSRAILAASKDEAKAYFNKAVEVANRIGRENLDRWSAILYLADRAAPESPAPMMAYKLSRCAELTRDYVDRDKHFDWESTVESIAALCPSSCIAILSRWRDRNFGWAERLLPVALEFLVKNRGSDSLAQLALVGFRAQWDFSWLLESALSACQDRVEKERVVKYFYRYAKFDSHSSKTWVCLKEACSRHGLPVPQVDDLIAVRRKEEEAVRSKETWRTRSNASEDAERGKKDWDSIFSKVDLTHAEDISIAYLRFRDTEPPFYSEQFFKEVMKRIPIGQESEFIRALPHTVEFSLYEFRTFLESLPDEWREMLAVKDALRDTLKLICRRYCMEISKSRYYEILPINTACELCGVSEGEVADVVLSALGETTNELRSGRLFTLTSLLALKMQPGEALDVLDFGLDLLNGFLSERDGDGDWAEGLLPPEEVSASLAGYVWAALAAPNAGLRWQAAHVVRGLCYLNRQAVIGELVRLAKSERAGPFTDGSLHFYNLHALQWLLMALARAAKESAESVLPHAEYLLELALRGTPHVLHRKFAAEAVLGLVDQNVLSVDEDVVAALRAVNVSKIPVDVKERFERTSGWPDTSSEDDESGERFYFGIDMEPYWFAPLGRRFSLSQIDVARRIKKIVVDEWGFGRANHWEIDARARRRLYSGGETMHSHGSYPKTDDLQFYLSYHGMMIVAGQLLSTHPLSQDSDDPNDEFLDWLHEHSLGRHEDLWLADRRDPRPIDRPLWEDDESSKEWLWSIQLSDFDRCLGVGEERLNLWGSWTNVSADRVEAVTISSSLVSPVTSHALLRALQTAQEPHGCPIPGEYDEDDAEVVGGDYQVLGWIIDGDESSRTDRFDPWAGDIKYPPLVPANFVEERFDLVSDSECRFWRKRGDVHGNELLSSEVWGTHRVDDNDSEGEHGRRIRAKREFVVEILSAVNLDLIVRVQISRRFTRSRYGSYQNDEFGDKFGYVAPYTRIYIIGRDGEFHTL